MTQAEQQIQEISLRIREMRQIMGYSTAEMAIRTQVTEPTYVEYENGTVDLPFSFIHKCALAFGIELTDLLEGYSAHLSNYTVTRKDRGITTAHERGIRIQNLAPMFRQKIAEPYWVRYDYLPEQQDKPIHLATHAGQEFDLILKGSLKVQIGEHVEILHEGDSIYYDSATPHGMIAVEGEECLFLAVVLHGKSSVAPEILEKHAPVSETDPGLCCMKFIKAEEDENGTLKSIDFMNEDQFNFGFDIVDAVARKDPDKLAMLHLSRTREERRFTFKDIKDLSAQSANYFTSLGIKKGDRVMLVLKRHWQFWPAMVALCKLGAIAIPATNQLMAHDFEYRFQAAGVSAILCTADGDVAHQVELAAQTCPTLKTKILVGGSREDWHDFNSEFGLFSRRYQRTQDTPCGDEPMLMFFTSGTTGYPKIATHSFKYPLGHYITAKYWHCVHRDGIHFTISDTGWGKALWGKFYGQWLCEGGVFTYDFDRFDAADILPLFGKYRITTFCAPPTMYRMMIKEDLTQYDFSSVVRATTAGEALNPEVYYQFEKLTGLQLIEGFGQTETTLSIANLVGNAHKVGSMGKASPLYDIALLDPDGNPVAPGQSGEICIRTSEKRPCGLFLGYYLDQEKTDAVLHDGWYHTGDVAWQDEQGYFWYVSRVDDVIKSSGYRIGPFEIESVIMELPYVLECGVTGAPDEVRGQVVKACIVLTKGTQPSDQLKKEIQTYVKQHTAPYKYPRIVEFRDELPKTISGKIQRNKL
ncbi:MAG: AMP-binding protein [Clostridia bacterium]|nr:AMP-binding protein [Clostridia bacterium]